ncbi:MAG: ribonuclease Y [Nitrospirales bacterium]|nr:ribonuclease Y [Nitrospirales bacterium]
MCICAGRGRGVLKDGSAAPGTKGGGTITIIEIAIIIVAVAAGAAIGIGMLWLIQGKVVASRLREAEERAAQIVKAAEKEAVTGAREAKVEAKGMIVQAKADLDKEIQAQRAEILGLEKRQLQKEEALDRKVSTCDRRESELQKKEKAVALREKEIVDKAAETEHLVQERTKALEYAAGMTAAEAKAALLAQVESDVKFESAKMIKRIQDETKEIADREAKDIITRSIQRITRDYVSEATISVVAIPNDSMKGRIIGREGRNIRALEAATGIDLVVDETPEAVLISGFDPLRREIAKVSLERLMADGRIHPTRIEEVVERVKKDLDKMMIEEAEKILFELGIPNVNMEIVKLLGKLKFRTSYGQNNLYHAREAAYICGIMAAELELDVKLARRGALMHDMGKALSQEEEGPHAIIGGDFAKKYGEEPRIVNAIAAHHEQVEPICPETVLVAAGEALSAARPGARRETVESYIKRLEKLEKLAVDYKGVEKAYAIQAGREIRVIVKQEAISDAECAVLSRDLARKIEQELTYPGQIKVTVIRESRYIDVAK